MMFDFLKTKPKDKEKPEPTCYLFIGEQQCIGGYQSFEEAHLAIRGEETVDCFISSDMQGSRLIYRYETQVLSQHCGCQWSLKGWHDIHRDVFVTQEMSLLLFCGNPAVHPVVNCFASGYTSGYLTHTPWNLSGIVMPYTVMNPLSDGDPLE